MKTRSGVPESRAFGPAMSRETRWVIVPRAGELVSLLKGNLTVRHSSGPTAFAACARLGISLGEVVDIRPVTEAAT